MAEFISVKFRIAEKTDQTDANGQPLYRMGTALMSRETLLESFDKFLASQDEGACVSLEQGKDYYLMIDLPHKRVEAELEALKALQTGDMTKNRKIKTPRKEGD